MTKDYTIELIRMKDRQCQIRLTEGQYQYLQVQKEERRCTASAYLRALLLRDMMAGKIQGDISMP